MSRQENILTSLDQIEALLMQTRRIAVLGIKPETRSDQPAFYVPRYLVSAGLEVIPVPVYYPEVEQILGRKIYRRLADIPGPIDLVDVFRKSEDIPQHLDDLLAKPPKAVWLQLGIRNDAVAETLARAGIKVIQDRCLMVDHRRMLRG